METTTPKDIGQPTNKKQPKLCNVVAVVLTKVNPSMRHEQNGAIGPMPGHSNLPANCVAVLSHPAANETFPYNPLRKSQLQLMLVLLASW